MYVRYSCGFEFGYNSTVQLRLRATAPGLVLRVVISRINPGPVLDKGVINTPVSMYTCTHPRSTLLQLSDTAKAHLIELHRTVILLYHPCRALLCFALLVIKREPEE